MKKEEQLREQQEELFFKMMFAGFDKTDAPKYEALNEQLKNDPAYQESEEETQAMLDFIAREIKIRDEETTKHPQKKTIRRISSALIKVAVIAAILMLMTVAAYASIPSFRVMALNLLLEASGEATRVAITDRNERSDRSENLDGTGIVLLGYSFPGVPEGFQKVEDFNNGQRVWVRYANEQGKSIKYQVYCDIERDVALDTEDASAKEIKIHGCEGILSTKGSAVAVSWYDAIIKTYIRIEAKGFDVGFVYNLATGVEKAE